LHGLDVIVPFTPMGWIHIDRLSARRIDPTMLRAPATDQKRVRVAALKNRELKVAIKGRTGNRLPGVLGHWERKPEALC